jgi:hypothetical protein
MACQSRRGVGDSTSRRFRRHLQRPLNRFLKFSRSSTPLGSQPAFASGHVATRVRPATGRPSLFPSPIPASPSVGLTASLPSRKERYGLTAFHKVDRNGLGALCSPVVFGVHDRGAASPCTHYGALLAQASQHLWLAFFYDVYREFICVHHTIHPAPSPLDASRYVVPSRCRRQSGDCGYLVRGHLTARYLAAVPRRILLMEQQVWPVQLAKQSTLRPRVAERLKNSSLSRCLFVPIKTKIRVSLRKCPKRALQNRLWNRLILQAEHRANGLTEKVYFFG